MPCEYCYWTIGHPSSCPNASEPKFTHYCSICGEGIYDGDEYVENDDGEFIHLDCPTIKDMVAFLGYEVKLMECEDDQYSVDG